MSFLYRLTAIPIARIKNVARTKRLSPEMSLHFQREFLDVIKKDFTDANGKTSSEREIEARIGISQSVINEIRNWKADGEKPINVGVATLLALSEYTHKSIDALLGRELALPIQQRQDQLDAIVSKAEELMQLLSKESTFSFGPKSKIGKLRDEIQRMARTARSQREMDERERRVNEMSLGPKRKTG